MKKIFSCVLIICMLLCLSAEAFAATPRVLVGGEKLKSDVVPMVQDGRILLPVRAVFESIGASVNYIEAEQKVVAKKKDTTVELTVGSNVMMVNGEKKEMDVAVVAKDNRTFVPLRACAEAFNVPVEWVEKTNTANVKIPVSLIAESYGPGVVGSGSTTTYKYDDRGNLIEENYNGSITKYQYDEFDNIIHVETRYGTSERIYTFNENGDIATREIHSSMEGAPIIKTTFTYDDKRNLVQLHGSESGITNYTYDERGNNLITETRTSKTIYEYDDRNNCTLSYGSEKAWFRYVYDDYNNMIFGEFNEWNHNFPNRKCTYDKENSVLYVEDSGVTAQWNLKYDSNNKLTYRSDGNGNYVKYEYDENGNLIYKEDNKGRGGAKTWEKYVVIVK